MMEVIFSLPILIIPFILPLIAGLMAKSYGRSFWTWFLIAIPLPLIANVILLCLPDRTLKQAMAVRKEGSLHAASPARIDLKDGDDRLDLSAIA